MRVKKKAGSVFRCIAVSGSIYNEYGSEKRGEGRGGGGEENEDVCAKLVLCTGTYSC